MQIRSFMKLGLVLASTLLLASCSKHSITDALGEGGSVFSHGLGKMVHFPGQEVGESYTSRAPHNQFYLFAYDDSAVAGKYLPSINAQAEYLKSHPNAKIVLNGHTDERGSREYNIALGERRAQSVASIMRMSGVSRHQIRVVSYGKEQPIYLGHDDESRRQNRRVELIYEASK